MNVDLLKESDRGGQAVDQLNTAREYLELGGGGIDAGCTRSAVMLASVRTQQALKVAIPDRTAFLELVDAKPRLIKAHENVLKVVAAVAAKVWTQYYSRHLPHIYIPCASTSPRLCLARMPLELLELFALRVADARATRSPMFPYQLGSETSRMRTRRSARDQTLVELLLTAARSPLR